jgi:tetratricopeptide (TPR) repeat protein
MRRLMPWHGYVSGTLAMVGGFMIVMWPAPLSATESNLLDTVAAAAGNATGSSEALRSYLQLQAQLHETQLALERNRQEAEIAAARNAEAVTARLQLVEQALTSQRARELEAMQSANRWVLIVAGTFAAVGFLAMLLTAYLQWRAVNRLAEFSAVPSAGLLFGGGRAQLPFAAGEAQLIGGGVVEQSNGRLLGALDRLEKRILELEQTAHTPPVGGAQSSAGFATFVASAGASRITLLLAKGESLLNLDKTEEAVACFNEILTLAPAYPEALVKKGDALERLGKIDEAIDCYDRAIATDGSMTIAYLHKGGLFNRLERYEDALQCYEQALRSQEKGRAA